MSLALAGKGGGGRTSPAVWLADHLTRQGKQVRLVDADAALPGASIGPVAGGGPVPLLRNEDPSRGRTGSGGFSRRISPGGPAAPGHSRTLSLFPGRRQPAEPSLPGLSGRDRSDDLRRVAPAARSAGQGKPGAG
jgi:hypothetical protein